MRFLSKKRGACGGFPLGEAPIRVIIRTMPELELDKVLPEEDYDASSIEVLSGLEGVRKRPGMYIGSTGPSGLHHLVWEILDNAVDEAVNGYGKKISLTMHKDGSISIEDEGRGMPVDIHPKTGIPAIQLIFTALHSGGKFNSAAYKVSGGLHGVGATVTNALSERVKVNVWRKGKAYEISFKDGGKLEEPLRETGDTWKHGTMVTFKPDPQIFPNTRFSYETIAHRLEEKSYLLTGVRFILVDENTGQKKEFYCENGLREYVLSLTKGKTPLGDVIDFSGEKEGIRMEVALRWSQGDYQESIYSYANDVRTGDGGTHESGFKSGLTKCLNEWAQANGLLKGQALEGSDIREGLTAVVSVKVPEGMNELEGQTKGKLGTPAALPAVSALVQEKLPYFLDEHREFGLELVRKCEASRHAREAARKAREAVRGTRKRTPEAIISDKLAAAQGKDYKKNELFIVEGDSAGGTAKTGRDRSHQAILPLRGKPLNTYGLPIGKVMENVEFATLVQTIGAGAGEEFDPKESHYGKIIIMTDADTDGAHIQTLLLTFFWNFMRPLVDQGMVYVAQPPLYRVYKKSDPSRHVYCWSEEELEAARKKIGAGYGINRYKGLGEMNAQQLAETTMNPGTRQLLRVVVEDPLALEKKMGVLMGKDSLPRWDWIQENVTFVLEDEFQEILKGEESHG